MDTMSSSIPAKKSNTMMAIMAMSCVVMAVSAFLPGLSNPGVVNRVQHNLPSDAEQGRSNAAKDAYMVLREMQKKEKMDCKREADQ